VLITARRPQHNAGSAKESETVASDLPARAQKKKGRRTGSWISPRDVAGEFLLPPMDATLAIGSFVDPKTPQDERRVRIAAGAGLNAREIGARDGRPEWPAAAGAPCEHRSRWRSAGHSRSSS
jgi:hypothetical protein